MNETRAHIRLRIEEAFADVPYPGDGRIAPHDCGECRSIREALQGTHWRDWADKPVTEIRRNAELALLQPEALRFFLPAFLIAVLREPGPAQWILEQLFFLLSCKDEKRRPALEAFLKQLTHGQLEALLSFVEWVEAEIPEYAMPEEARAAKSALRAAL